MHMQSIELEIQAIKKRIEELEADIDYLKELHSFGTKLADQTRTTVTIVMQNKKAFQNFSAEKLTIDLLINYTFSTILNLKK